MKGCHLDTGSKWLSLSSRIQAMLLQLQDSTLIMSTHTLEQMHTYLVSKHVSLKLPDLQPVHLLLQHLVQRFTSMFQWFVL
ncbi:hypothetical protein KC19_8G022600 [Ceratodon purpureus]|uniref:Uncharacterized protein n=1 Tax=Ceratodon purpureus TaxID=3225 RepID=A0A8T0GXQ1_CERPU|nr:hypothetical protein KC19_8G022600 [Ceratodon purpureus]